MGFMQRGLRKAAKVTGKICPVRKKHILLRSGVWGFLSFMNARTPFFE